MTDKEEAGEYLRCFDCKKLISKATLQREGVCSACGSRRMRSTNPTRKERILIRLGIIK